MTRPKTEPLKTDDVLAAELDAWLPLRGTGETSDPDAPAIHRLHHAQPVALCLSGGGIRSATFGLGVLQGLARKGLLGQFDYISTVSGGGYIGSWLTSWISRRREPETVVADEVSQKLAEGDEKHPYPEGGESREIRHLREFSNYLTPKLGLLSVDSWTLAATWLRNVIVNWFVLLPFFLAVLAVPRIWTSALVLGPNQMLTLLAVAALTGTVLVAYLAMIRPVPDEYVPADEDEARYGLRFAILGPGMLLLQALAMCSVRAIRDEQSGSGSQWWKATWGDFAGSLPLGNALAAKVEALANANPDLPLLVSLMLSVVLLNHIGWAIYTGRLMWKGKLSPKRAAGEFAGALVAGATTGLFLWLIIIKLFPDPTGNAASVPLNVRNLSVEGFATFAPALYLLAFFVQTMMFVGATGKLNEDQDREWWARWAGWLLIVAAGTLGLNAIAIFGPLLIATLPKTFAAVGGVAGLVTLFLGRSGASPATPSQQLEKGWPAKATNAALALAAPIFVVIILSLFSLFNTWLLQHVLGVPGLTPLNPAIIKGGLEPLAIEHFAVLRRTPLLMVALYAAVLFAVSLIASAAVQINRFSMHALYRDRLTRAYLGASNAERRASVFTGFDDRDNVHVEDLPRRPFHIVNVALNLVSAKKLAWQERKAAPFTISPLHCGTDLLGYRPSSEFAKHGRDNRGITLGTAMAISGAAVSPNMGYHTSPAMSFLLTLFNVRLGWWLGNPGLQHYDKPGPYSSLLTILKEAFGKTGKDSWWVYLSDGGHFENLGLYEMVRRRCHTIVVSDAGRDPKIAYEDLGNAIRKIRIDLGIPITIDDARIYPREARKSGQYFATGTIHYDVADQDAKPGMLVYLKPCFYGEEPIDIRNYASQNMEFPHESTADQWFTESQFESYRALGAHIVEQLCGKEPLPSLRDLAEQLRARRDQTAAPAAHC